MTFAWEISYFFGFIIWRCSHYRRRCKIRAPCCNEIFDCRHCHNEAKVGFWLIVIFIYMYIYWEIGFMKLPIDALYAEFVRCGSSLTPRHSSPRYGKSKFSFKYQLSFMFHLFTNIASEFMFYPWFSYSDQLQV